MSPGKRILLNVIVTYARSLYSVVLGLFTARWILQALGAVDYGLYGLIGGLVGFISFFNSLLAVSTSRFFAYSVGEIKGENPDVGLYECRAWFCSALSFHFVLGCILVVIGYPIGVWAVRNFLSIPVDRVFDCVWVWRMVCINCFVHMINVPFSAMYNAKQEIAEVSLYGFFTATANVVFLLYMVHNPGDWLVRYSIWGTVLVIVPLLVMCARAMSCFTECRFVKNELFNLSRLKRMVSYSSAQFMADFSSLISSQGMSVVVNKLIGPVYNASMSIANSVSSQTLTLGSAMIGALQPAITNAAGAKQYDRMRFLSYQSCKFGVLFVVLFAIPMILEVNEIMRLWLKTPPDGAGMLCSMLLISFLINRSTTGLSSAVEALGKIGLFKLSMGLAGLCPVVLAYVLIKLGFGLRGVGYAILVTNIPYTIIRLYFSKRLAGISIRYWLKNILIPNWMVIMLGFLISFLPHLFMIESLHRVIITVIVSTITLTPLIWFVAFSNADRQYVQGSFHKLKDKFLRKS